LLRFSFWSLSSFWSFLSLSSPSPFPLIILILILIPPSLMPLFFYPPHPSKTLKNPSNCCNLRPFAALCSLSPPIAQKNHQPSNPAPKLCPICVKVSSHPNPMNSQSLTQSITEPSRKTRVLPGGQIPPLTQLKLRSYEDRDWALHLRDFVCALEAIEEIKNKRPKCRPVSTAKENSPPKAPPHPHSAPKPPPPRNPVHPFKRPRLTPFAP
jgi:hypothetical protein